MRRYDQLASKLCDKVVALDLSKGRPTSTVSAIAAADQRSAECNTIRARWISLYRRFQSATTTASKRERSLPQSKTPTAVPWQRPAPSVGYVNLCSLTCSSRERLPHDCELVKLAQVETIFSYRHCIKNARVVWIRDERQLIKVHIDAHNAFVDNFIVWGANVQTKTKAPSACSAGIGCITNKHYCDSKCNAKSTRCPCPGVTTSNNWC